MELNRILPAQKSVTQRFSMVHMHIDIGNVRCVLNDGGILLSRGNKLPSLPAEPSEQEMGIETLISQRFIAGYHGRALPWYNGHLDLSDH